ncbi:hypothetical protein SAMN05216360_1266 [Methylobacterium phyllostachyos]|uniref:Uncharacterized protein n=1 Tax=Methylobacterium phyllostachyos TaxID=582672 RepID=A0A1H0KBX8_9HYPH|nr:hypothetical protein SAMN05216360_1266 [Methylobacterium phyllostachyos]
MRLHDSCGHGIEMMSEMNDMARGTIVEELCELSKLLCRTTGRKPDNLTRHTHRRGEIGASLAIQYIGNNNDVLSLWVCRD